jgi:hypothetical protein
MANSHQLKQSITKMYDYETPNSRIVANHRYPACK